MHSTHAYGDHPDQVVDLTTPAAGIVGVVVLVHGGYWRHQHTRALTVPLARRLVRNGWVVANVEYRRLGGGGDWPTFRDDVAAALGLVRAAALRHGWRRPHVVVGHSVGGQLALLTADAGVDRVVALAPVTDLARTRRERLGDDAVRALLPEEPDARPEAYAEGSPLHQLPVRVPVLVVHGDADTRVPLAHSRAFTERAREAGDEVELLVLPGVDHFSLIEPDQGWWEPVTRWMGAE